MSHVTPYALAQELSILQRDQKIIKVGEHECLPIEDVPKDGRMVQLLVRQLDDDECAASPFVTPWTPLEDAWISWTIGFNTLEDTGEDEWKLVGWTWTHDEFIMGTGIPIGWLPLHWGRP